MTNYFDTCLSKQIQENVSVSIAAYLWERFEAGKTKVPDIFSRVNATLEAAVSVGLSVCRSVT